MKKSEVSRGRHQANIISLIFFSDVLLNFIDFYFVPFNTKDSLDDFKKPISITKGEEGYILLNFLLAIWKENRQ